MNFAGQQTVCQIFDLHPKIPSFYRWTYSDLPICWMNKLFFHNLSNISICFSYGMFCSRFSKHLRFLHDSLTCNQNTMLHSGDVCRWMNLILSHITVKERRGVLLKFKVLGINTSKKKKNSIQVSFRLVMNNMEKNLLRL